MWYGVDAQQSRWSLFTTQMAYFVLLEAMTRGPALFQPACAAQNLAPVPVHMCWSGCTCQTFE